MEGKVEQLQSPDEWDLEGAEIREPVKNPRVVVSVAFRRPDFDLVSDFARRVGKKTSEFIREAAVESAVGETAVTFIYTSGSQGALWWTREATGSTRALGDQIDQPLPLIS